MAQRYHLLKNPIEFIVPTGKSAFDLTCQASNSGRNNYRKNVLCGDEAKKLYEDIINEPSSSAKIGRNKQKSCINVKNAYKEEKPIKHWKLQKRKIADNATNSSITCNAYFRAAESGDLTEVERIVTGGSIDLNAVDQFKWTALMMASQQGHEDVVKYLLIQGADWNGHYDGSGYDAYDLACLAGHDRIAHMLQHRKALVKHEARKEAVKLCQQRMKRERLWCEVCEIYYKATTHGNEEENEHQRSTSHQFCCKSKEEPPSTAHFYLSSQNKGYKILQKGGWDGNSGLGPSGSGKKYPVKTILKRDRSGLGCETSAAKVTHFGLNDKSAIVQAKKVKHKHLLKEREFREKSFETNFRRSFY